MFCARLLGPEEGLRFLSYRALAFKGSIFVFLFCFLFIDSVVVLLYSVCVPRLSHITIMVEWTLKVNYLCLYLSFCLWRTTMVLKGCVCWYCLGFCCRYFVIFCFFVCCCFLFYLSSFFSFFPSLFLFLFVCLFLSFFLSCSHFLSFFPSFSLKLFMSFSTCTRKLLLYV